MKKKLEADLISIAHRILKLKNKSDINQLYLETQKLYEKLAVLKFVDENFDTLKPTIGRSEIESTIETVFEKEEINIPDTSKAEEETPPPVEEIVTETTPEPEVTEEIKEEIVAEIPEEILPEPVAETVEEPVAAAEPVEAVEETVIENEKEPETTEEFSFRTVNDLKPIPDFKPSFELETEEKIEDEQPKIEVPARSDAVHISFEDILGVNYADAQFVKVDSFENIASAPTPTINELKEEEVKTAILESAKPKAVPLNEKLGKGFHIDLNDRIAFTKNLFAGSTEDYSRVLNQLLTFDSYGEAVNFIENMVKPDYNNWEGKDDYAQRFLEIVEKKFS
ncbi:hypothetical protein D0809_19390 [Flavobacterium circumlabens]|uniref:Uncharacterized protein n=1 Tax=Flavobacterium circumlabens TaxID=2133765 RepID=A0A4Y7U8H8_9FLAO|nr:hypothetical protein [Flavobacterium circumlabens]TCN53881.1 hypothetical protein EV142_108187 [Flavobacterium circumlabens]TEB42531.1 hypothetical protein D0809_19390 [Flavobacterium circumlabens]